MRPWLACAATLASTGDIAALAKSDIFAFDADDNNSGFMTTMKFARGAYPDQKIVLTGKSSKKISGRRNPYAPTSAFAGSTACTTRPRARASITPTARNASSVTV